MKVRVVSPGPGQPGQSVPASDWLRRRCPCPVIGRTDHISPGGGQCWPIWPAVSSLLLTIHRHWAQDRHRDGKRWRKLQTFLSSDGTYPLFQSDPRRTSFLGPGSWPVYCLYNLSTSVPTRLHQAGSLCTRERRIEMIERKLVIPFNWDWLEEEALTNVSLGRPAPLRARDFSNCEMRQVLIHKMTRKQVMDDS